MNINELDVLRTIRRSPETTQRMLAETSGYSLGFVNRTLKGLHEEDCLDAEGQLTEKARELFRDRSPKTAVILAAGFGMRMVPINTLMPKALMTVRGEVLIERQIRQLREAGIDRILVVVGFLKERFEYLMDEFGVELVVNPDYKEKNNLYSIARVLSRLENAYIVPCDLWCEENPFRKDELYSWYMVTDGDDPESSVTVNRKRELVRTRGGNRMVGICYLLKRDALEVKKRVESLIRDSRYDEAFWEEALYEKDRMLVPARTVPEGSVTEINTYEQLRDFDAGSGSLKSDAISVIAESLRVSPGNITDIHVLKKGMTNRSFLFTAKGRKYIMRIPGEGTDRLINRREEASVYQAISGKGLCDDPVYLNPDNGYKLTRYLENVRVCDPLAPDDLKKAMEKLVSFHRMKLQVPHTFDLFHQIDLYEQFWEGKPSIYRDYLKTKARIMELEGWISRLEKDWCLTHVDAVPDNFLFYPSDEGEKVQLTDWEYAGMQDPHLDIAMFSIYSFYDRSQADHLMDLYFSAAGKECTPLLRAKIYAYMASGGLLWSNWCEFKSIQGIEFGEYSLRQYRYAKEFYDYAMEEKNR